MTQVVGERFRSQEDAANGVSSAITLPVLGLLVLATVILGKRAAAAQAPA